VHLAWRALHPGQPRDRLGQLLFQPPGVAAGLGDERRHAAIFLIQERKQQVLRLDVLLILAERRRLGFGQRLLQLGGEFLESHGLDISGDCLEIAVTAQMGPLNLYSREAAQSP
jgi:hypothetical protein